ncbi:MAG TPA: N-6 DNA methylase [Pseudonocardiaceae bacterium]
MTAVRARQQVQLTPAATLLRQVVRDTDDDPAAARDVLEAAAGQIGGFDLDGYRQVLGIEARLDAGLAVAWAGKLLDLIAASGVPTRMALATLAQPVVTDTRRRVTGAYYTDFRLARYLARRTAQLAAAPLTPAGTVLDTAAGTGVLLVAMAEQIGGPDAGALRDLVGHGLSGVDLDPESRRGTVAALASLTGDLAAIAAMAQRIRTADSLLAEPGWWRGFSDDGRFDAVIGNPPWERLRVTRHETLLAGGAQRHYGADYEPGPRPGHPASGADGRSGAAERLRSYVGALTSRYPLLGAGEIDLCHTFLALGWSLAGPGGSLGMLVPAGLIRAQGTRPLRAHLFTNAAEVDMTVFHNRSRFFDIDTRFKFLAVCAQVAPGRKATIRLRYSQAADGGSGDGGGPEPRPVRITFGALATARRDLTVPEVSDEREWRIFRHMTVRGSFPRDPDGPWGMRITREADMTRARPLFRRTASAGHVPVVEGRMVHQYRSRAKTYLSGTGRTAVWAPLALGDADRALPQFFVDPARLSDSARQRIALPRVGFCDIVGQTNERTLQAALIQPGRVCGNKVPTIEFLAADAAERRAREMLFLAAANSLVVDWFVRRVVTTSLNFFILLDLPLPALDPNAPAGRRLVELAERLVAGEGAPGLSARQVAEDRAEIDMLICAAYGIDPADLPVILADFPLLDRHQPALPGERRSTITSDLLAGRCGDGGAHQRYQAAASGGALAYVPAEFARFGTATDRGAGGCCG